MVKIKNITYSSEFVEGLEKEIQELTEDNTDLRRKLLITQNKLSTLKVYEKALRLAILDVANYGSDWSFIMGFSEVNNQYDENSDSLDRYDKVPLSDIEGFYIDQALTEEFENWGNILDSFEKEDK